MQLLVAPGSLARTDVPAGKDHYRPDIDGLRAIAVLAVIGFHAGLPGVEGGFVGVDIFFVISGYLISGILMKEIARESFSYRSFYERRARRILPALFAVLAATAIASSWILIPSGFAALGKSMVAAILSASNFYFWSEASYFGIGAAQMPLLHTWSLAIEEQFYLLLPPYLALMRRAFGPRWLLFFVPITLVSFAACVIGTARAPSAAFYFPFTRAWELAIGGTVAALVGRSSAGHRAAELQSWLGAAMMGGAILFFDERMQFPGAVAAIPSVGAALVLHAGGVSGAESRTRVQRGLMGRPLVFVGLLSYSLYLWHWPILVLSRTAFTGPPDAVETFALLGLTFAAGYLSWRFVETPFRHRRPGRSSVPFFWGCAAGASVLLAFGGVVGATSGVPARFSEPVRTMALAPDDINPRRAECDKPSLERVSSGTVCHLGTPGIEPSVALVGDSFADALSPALEEAAQQAGSSVAIYSRSGCRPLLVDETRAERAGECSAFVAATLDALARDATIQTVVLFMSWPTMFMGWRYTVNIQKIDFLADLATRAPSTEDSLRVLELALHRMFERLSQKQIVVVAHWPEQKIFVPQAIATRTALQLPLPLGVSSTELELREHAMRALLKRLSVNREFRVIDLSEQTCRQGHCAVFRDGYSLYVDYNHMSRTAARALAPLFVPLF